jgi:DNA (cytosine-5)-methyltransferase 1
MNAKKTVKQLLFSPGNQPKLISLFSGCGGLDLGFHLEGYQAVWANEFNTWAADTYKRNFQGVEVDRRSILDIDPYKDSRLPSADLITGGFPCQDFSIIWKRPGLDGSRGSLYKEYLRFVDAKKPKAFVAENVKGILSANGGLAIKQIIKDFESIAPGYCLNIKLYNFADYGVPQFRERVLIVGVRNDTGFDFRHPKPTHGPKAGKPYFTAGKALENVNAVLHNNDHMKIMPRTREILEKIPEGGNFADIPKDDSHYVKGMISHVYRRIHREEPAKTLIAAGGGGTWGYHYPEPRALTNRERARLQAFPDNFVFQGSFGEVRRQIGNAVPPEGVRLLARALKPLFSGEYSPVDLLEKNKKLNAIPLKERIEIDRYETASEQQKTCHNKGEPVF